MAEEESVEEGLVPVLEPAEENVLFDRRVLPAVVLVRAFDLLLERRRVGRQESREAERLALLGGERGSLVEQRVVQQGDTARRDLPLDPVLSRGNVSLAFFGLRLRDRLGRGGKRCARAEFPQYQALGKVRARRGVAATPQAWRRFLSREPVRTGCGGAGSRKCARPSVPSPPASIGGGGSGYRSSVPPGLTGGRSDTRFGCRHPKQSSGRARSPGEA